MTQIKKACNNCIDLTLHEFVEEFERTLENYRPYTGKRYLKAREAKQHVEVWKCLECGRQAYFYGIIEYPDLRRKLDTQ